MNVANKGKAGAKACRDAGAMAKISVTGAWRLWGVVSLAPIWPLFARIWPGAASPAREHRIRASIRDPVPRRPAAVRLDPYPDPLPLAGAGPPLDQLDQFPGRRRGIAGQRHRCRELVHGGQALDGVYADADHRGAR